MHPGQGEQVLEANQLLLPTVGPRHWKTEKKCGLWVTALAPIKERTPVIHGCWPEDDGSNAQSNLGLQLVELDKKNRAAEGILLEGHWTRLTHSQRHQPASADIHRRACCPVTALPAHALRFAVRPHRPEMARH